MKSINALTKDAARLEHEKSFRTTMVYIESVSPDFTRARVRPASGGTRTFDTIEARIILTPGLWAPINVSNYMGLLHGDPKTPIGVQLIAKSTPRPNTKHGLSTALFGQSGNKNPTPVTGQATIATDSIEQYINEHGHPDPQAVVIKPTKPLPPDYLGDNPILPDAPGYLIDDYTAYVSVDEEEVRLVADFGNAMIINKQSGISIMGQFNIGTGISDIRMGGAWRVNPMTMFQIPSTVISPIPTLIFDPPGTNLTQSIQSVIDSINSIAL
jgi:hypothetical protein